MMLYGVVFAIILMLIEDGVSDCPRTDLTALRSICSVPSVPTALSLDDALNDPCIKNSECTEEAIIKLNDLPEIESVAELNKDGVFIFNSHWTECGENHVLTKRTSVFLYFGGFKHNSKRSYSSCQSIDTDKFRIDDDDNNSKVICVGAGEFAKCPKGMVIVKSCVNGCSKGVTFCDTTKDSDENYTGIFCRPILNLTEAEIKIVGYYGPLSNGKSTDSTTFSSQITKYSSVEDSTFERSLQSWNLKMKAGGVFKAIGLSMEASIGGSFTEEVFKKTIQSTQTVTQHTEARSCEIEVPFGYYYRQYMEDMVVDNIKVAKLRHCFAVKSNSEENDLNPQCPPESCIDVEKCNRCAKNDKGEFILATSIEPEPEPEPEIVEPAEEPTDSTSIVIASVAAVVVVAAVALVVYQNKKDKNFSGASSYLAGNSFRQFSFRAPSNFSSRHMGSKGKHFAEHEAMAHNPRGPQSPSHSRGRSRERHNERNGNYRSPTSTSRSRDRSRNRNKSSDRHPAAAHPRR